MQTILTTAGVVALVFSSLVLIACFRMSSRCSQEEDERDLRREAANHGRVLVTPSMSDDEILTALGQALAAERRDAA